MSANERRTGRPVWIVASRAALLLLPLLLGVAATALLADSGSAPLPRIAGPGSHSSLPPTRSVVVSTQAFGGHSSHQTTAHASRVSKPATRHVAASGTSHQTVGLVTTEPAVSRTHKSSTGGTKSSHPSTKGGVGSSSTGGSTPPTTPTAAGHSEPPPTSVSAADQQSCASGASFPPGRALGRRSHTPRGRALGHRNHATCTSERHVPPGQAHKAQAENHDSEAPVQHEDSHASHGHHAPAPQHRHAPQHQHTQQQHHQEQPQASHQDDSGDDDEQGHTPPGHAYGHSAHGHGSHGHGHDH